MELFSLASLGWAIAAAYIVYRVVQYRRRTKDGRNGPGK
jgi:hypothetical protein